MKAEAVETVGEVKSVRDWQGEISLLPNGPAAFTILAKNLLGTLYETTESFVITPKGRVQDGDRDTRATNIDLRGARLEGADDGARFLVVLPPSTYTTQATLTGGLVDLGVTTSVYRLFPNVDESEGQTRVLHEAYETDGPRILAQGAGIASYDGPIEIFAWSTRLTGKDAEGGDVVAKSGEETRPDPLLGSIAPRAVVTTHHFVGTAKHLAVDGRGERFAYWAKKMTVSGALDVSMANATGTLVTDTGDRHVSTESVRLVGDPGELSLLAPFSEADSRIDIVGSDLFTVYVGGRRVGAAPEPQFRTTAVTATGLAAVAAMVGAVAYHFTVAPILPGFLRRQKPDEEALAFPMLRNETRRKILEVVRQHPGVQQSHIWKRIGGAFGVTLRGLDVLQRAGLVRSFKHGKNRHYYENAPKFTDGVVRIYAVMATRTLAQTFTVIQERGPITQKELAQALGITVSTLCGRLRRLEDHDMILRERRGGLNFYTKAPGASSAQAGLIVGNRTPSVPVASAPMSSSGLLLDPTMSGVSSTESHAATDRAKFTP